MNAALNGAIARPDSFPLSQTFQAPMFMTHILLVDLSFFAHKLITTE